MKDHPPGSHCSQDQPHTPLLLQLHRWRLAVIEASFIFYMENFKGNSFLKNEYTILCVVLKFTH